jgi:hypothetical protein
MELATRWAAPVETGAGSDGYRAIGIWWCGGSGARSGSLRYSGCTLACYWRQDEALVAACAARAEASGPLSETHAVAAWIGVKPWLDNSPASNARVSMRVASSGLAANPTWLRTPGAWQRWRSSIQPLGRYNYSPVDHGVPAAGCIHQVTATWGHSPSAKRCRCTGAGRRRFRMPSFQIADIDDQHRLLRCGTVTDRTPQWCQAMSIP